MPHEVWALEGPIALAVQGLCLLGFIWTGLTCLTFMYNDLFGFSEALTGVAPHWVPHYMPFVYKYTRSPLWFGIITTLWAASEMVPSSSLSLHLTHNTLVDSACSCVVS